METLLGLRLKHLYVVFACSWNGFLMAWYLGSVGRGACMGGGRGEGERGGERWNCIAFNNLASEATQCPCNYMYYNQVTSNC